MTWLLSSGHPTTVVIVDDDDVVDDVRSLSVLQHKQRRRLLPVQRLYGVIKVLVVVVCIIFRLQQPSDHTTSTTTIATSLCNAFTTTVAGTTSPTITPSLHRQQQTSCHSTFIQHLQRHRDTRRTNERRGSFSTTFLIRKSRQPQAVYESLPQRSSTQSSTTGSSSQHLYDAVENSNNKNDNDDGLINIAVIPTSLLSSSTSSSTATNDNNNYDSNIPVPTTMNEAIHVFFFNSQYHGPRLILLLLSIVLQQRIQLGYHTTYNIFQSSSFPFSINDICVATIAMVFWWFQEHFLHQQLLHSKHFDWIGKSIHEQHHNRPYHHISIDPASIMICWLTMVHLLLRYCTPLPLHLVCTATMAYGVAGLFYEWTHFIVHTKVRFTSPSFWQTTKNHHARHHLINPDNYFAFSMTYIDTLFGTNPDITTVPRIVQKKRKTNTHSE